MGKPAICSVNYMASLLITRYNLSLVQITIFTVILSSPVSCTEMKYDFICCHVPTPDFFTQHLVCFVLVFECCSFLFFSFQFTAEVTVCLMSIVKLKHLSLGLFWLICFQQCIKNGSHLILTILMVSNEMDQVANIRVELVLMKFELAQHCM